MFIRTIPSQTANHHGVCNSTVANGKQPIGVDSGSRFWLILQQEPI